MNSLMITCAVAERAKTNTQNIQRRKRNADFIGAT